MITKKILLFDGQELDRSQYNYLYQFHNTSEADIFTMYNSKLVLKFVGYIEMIISDVLYEIYCFPKEYNVCLNGQQLQSGCQLVSTQDVKQVEQEFAIVIKSITKASQAEKTVGRNKLEEFYTSNLHYLNEIIKHYNQYGTIVEIEKEHKLAPTGKINWNKTIGKVIPKLNKNNLIYDQFVIDKKNINVTFLAMLISKVIFEGTTKYSFCMPIIDTGINYDEIRAFDNQKAITILYELKNKTFKDYLHHVIDNLISYLQNDKVSQTLGVIVGTNNYNYVWEHVVAHGLGKNFNKTVTHTIGKYKRYDKTYGSEPRIELDHIDMRRKIIVDSKYYNNREVETLDYKQLFYNYHQVYLQMKDSKHITYAQILEEYKLWKNVLVKPTKEEGAPFSVFELDDNMRLYSLKINTRDYVEYYTTGRYKGKASYELGEYISTRLD